MTPALVSLAERFTSRAEAVLKKKNLAKRFLHSGFASIEVKIIHEPCGFSMLVEARNSFVASFTTEAGSKKTFLRGQLKLELLLKLPRHTLTKSCNPVKTLNEPVISDVTYLLLSRNIGAV